MNLKITTTQDGNKRRVAVNTVINVGFEVLTAVSTKMDVFWVVAPCSLVEVYQRFRGPCCFHHQGGSPTVINLRVVQTAGGFFTSRVAISFSVVHGVSSTN
jgi:hypothetical protein